MFSGTPDFALMSQRAKNSGAFSWMFSVLKQYFGVGPQGVFVFGNADVATYELYPDLPGVTGCSYTKGTARDATGKFINDRGMGGNGTSNGNNYVNRLDGTDFGIGMDNYTITCAYVLDGSGALRLIGCRID